MSTEPSPRAEQIQANVAAALSRLRGEPTASAAPNAMPSRAAMPAQNAVHDPAPEILTKAEPLIDVGDAQVHQAQPGIGAPDPAMAIGGHAGETPFERMTGLKVSGMKEAQPDLLQDMGVPPPPLADLPDAEIESLRRRRRLRNRLMLGGFAVVLLAGFWILSGDDSADQEVPVITADGTPERVKPEEEGGLTVPNQDVAILNNDAAGTASETVLPAPEQPATPPPPPEPASEPEASEPAAPVVSETTTAVPAIPSVSAPEPTTIPSVPAPAELGTEAPAAESAATTAEQPAAEAAAAAPETTATETTATETTAEAPATETASVEAAAAPTVTAAIQPVPGGKVRIQLASVKSEDGARQEWTRLQRAHPALLGGLELHVEKFEKSAGEIYYRVQAGPLGDAASAKVICSDLKQKNQACIVAK